MESMNVLGAYGSDDDDDNDDDDDGESDSDASVDIERDAVTAKDPTSMGKIALPSEHKPRPGPRCRFFARGNCRHGNKCRYVHEKPTVSFNLKRKDMKWMIHLNTAATEYKTHSANSHGRKTTQFVTDGKLKGQG